MSYCWNIGILECWNVGGWEDWRIDDWRITKLQNYKIMRSNPLGQNCENAFLWDKNA